jgi:hypothetical protein
MVKIQRAAKEKVIKRSKTPTSTPMYFIIVLFVFSVFSAPPDNINNIISDEDLQTVACTPETSPCRAFGEDGSPLLHAVDPWDVLVNEETMESLLSVRESLKSGPTFPGVVDA